MQHSNERFDHGSFQLAPNKNLSLPNLKVYDTPQRRKIRQLLGSADGTGQKFLTGIGGNGKSHNLALFVQEQKSVKNVVLYINTMERWIWFPRLIHAELWKAAVDGGIAVAGFTDSPTPAFTREFDYKLFMAHAYAVLDSCQTTGKRFFFVADQDNILSKQAQNKSKMVMNFDDFDGVINTIPSHVKILSASDNNEGWNRRNWTDRIVHYPEPVPEDVIGELFPKLGDATSDIRQMLRDEFNNYPLMLHIVNWFLQTGGPTDVDQVRKHLQKTISDKVVRYRTALSVEQQKFVFSGVYGVRDSFSEWDVYDHNHYYVAPVSHGGGDHTCTVSSDP